MSRGRGRLKGCAALTAAWLAGTFGGEVELALCLSAISATLHSCRAEAILISQGDLTSYSLWKIPIHLPEVVVDLSKTHMQSS